MGGIIILDQFTKILIQRTMELHQSHVIIKGFFNLTHIHNPGAAFGLFADHESSLRTLFLTIVGILAVILLGLFFRKSPDKAWGTHLAFSLILGGALGNLIDRIWLGAVVDFLDFYIGRYHWPAFNVADSSISVGLALLVILFLKGKGKADRDFLFQESG
jgi:signal peptidase II